MNPTFKRNLSVDTVETARLPFHPSPSDFSDSVRPSPAPLFSSLSKSSRCVAPAFAHRPPTSFHLPDVSLSARSTTTPIELTSLRAQSTSNSCLCPSPFDFARRTTAPADTPFRQSTCSSCLGAPRTSRSRPGWPFRQGSRRVAPALPPRALSFHSTARLPLSLSPTSNPFGRHHNFQTSRHFQSRPRQHGYGSLV